MAQRFILITFLLLFASPAVGSQPGQPLGPEDWVFNEPGMCAYSL